MLEVGVSGQYEKKAEDIISARALAFMGTDKSRQDYIDSLLTTLKDTVTTKLFTYVVEYKQDGTSSVQPIDRLNQDNPLVILDKLTDGGKTVMISNDQGYTICLAPIQVNGKTYLHTFKPEDAEALRAGMESQLTEPKEPTRYDWFCDWCARTFRNRPGKVVGEYNEHKAFNAAMRKALKDMAEIPEKVEGYRQEKAQKQFDEMERKENEQLEKERQKEEQLNQERLEEKRREQERINKENEEKQRIDNLKSEVNKPDPQYEAAKKQEKELLREKNSYEFRAQQIQKLEKELPELEERLGELTRIQKGMPNLATSEEQLKKLKEFIATDEKYYDQQRNDLNAMQNELKDILPQLKELNKLEEIDVPRKAAAAKMNAAAATVRETELQYREANAEANQLIIQYNKEKHMRAIFELTPEEYLKKDYEEKRAVREKEFTEKSKEEERKLDEYKKALAEFDKNLDVEYDQATFFEALPLVGAWFTDNGKVLSKKDDAKKQLKADIKRMEKEADQRQIDFDKMEEQLKKAALKPSEQELIGVKAFLEAGKEALDTKFKEFQTAFKKANDLKTLLNEQQRVSSEAAEAYRQLDGPEVKGKVYDKQKHEQLQDRKEKLIDEITAKKARLSEWNVELNDKRRMRDESETYIKNRKEEIAKRAEKIDELTKQVNSAKLTINMYKQQQMQSPYHQVVQGQAKPQQPVAQQSAREMKKPEQQAAPVRGK